MSLVRAQHLNKRYGETRALDDFNLEVEEGAILGLIGPNGSGKTTAFRALTGLLKLDSGELQVQGLDPFRERPAVMRHTAYIADVGTLPRWMRVRDLLRYVEHVHPGFDRAAAEGTLASTQVAASARVGALSKGMTVQLHLALVMATQARLLVLDEPTLGLDLIYRRRFYETLLDDYFEAGRSILVSTHEVAEIEHILTDVALIAHGRVRLQSSMDDLRQRFVKVIAPSSASEALKALEPLRLQRTLNGVEALYEGIDRTSLPPQVELKQPDLSELFVTLLGDL